MVGLASFRYEEILKIISDLIAASDRSAVWGKYMLDVGFDSSINFQPNQH